MSPRSTGTSDHMIGMRREASLKLCCEEDPAGSSGVVSEVAVLLCVSSIRQRWRFEGGKSYGP